MKTTIDIPDKVLKEAMKYAKASTKRDVVLTALEEYNRRRRIRALLKRCGKSKTFMTHDELMAMRAMD